MRRLLCALVVAIASAQQVEVKSGPLTEAEVRDLVQLTRVIEDTQKAAKPYIDAANDAFRKYSERKKQILKAHGCEFGQLTGGLQLTNCAYTPVKPKGK